MPFLDRVKKIVKTKDKGEKEGKKREDKGIMDEGGGEILTPSKKKKLLMGERLPFAKSDIGQADRVIISPLISEKATDLISRGQYVFRVKNRANKVEVRKAIAQLYGVTVVGIRMVTIPRKSRRRVRFIGHKAGYKKAIIEVKKGEKIEALSH